jgi:hypothetical protein
MAVDSSEDNAPGSWLEHRIFTSLLLIHITVIISVEYSREAIFRSLQSASTPFLRSSSMSMARPTGEWLLVAYPLPMPKSSNPLVPLKSRVVHLFSCHNIHTVESVLRGA